MHKRRNCKQREDDLKVGAGEWCSAKIELNSVPQAFCVSPERYNAGSFSHENCFLKRKEEKSNTCFLLKKEERKSSKEGGGSFLWQMALFCSVSVVSVKTILTLKMYFLKWKFSFILWQINASYKLNYFYNTVPHHVGNLKSRQLL